MPEEGSYVHSRGVAKCTRYSDKRLWRAGVDTIYQVINATCGSIHMGVLHSSKRLKGIFQPQYDLVFLFL